MSVQSIPEYAEGVGLFYSTAQHAPEQGGGPFYRAEVARLRKRLHNMQSQIEDLEHGYYVITPEGDWYGPEPTQTRIHRCSQSDFRDTDHTIVLVVDKVRATEEE